MAKTTGGLLSLDARGTVAGTLTFSNWKGQPYVRQTVTPSNPQTASQSQTRNAFTVANQAWKTAPALFIAPWDRFATGQKLTGRNAFVGRYVADLRGAADRAAMLFSPGAKGGLAPLSVVGAAGSSQIAVTVVPPAAPTGWTLEACVAAAIRDGDPETVAFNQIAAGEDPTDPYVITLTGLTVGELYVVGGWTRWVKPDGSIAYGASLNDTATPTA